MPSPESPIRTINPLAPPNPNPAGPPITGTTATVFDRLNVVADRYVSKIQIQVCSAVAVKFALNADAAADVFHGVLAADTGTDTGTGGVLNLDNLHLRGISKVTLYAAADFRVSVLKL